MYSKKINQLATNLNPQETDLIPIGDAETGQLKTTTFNAVSGITGDGIISGGIVTWTGTGLNFNISACTYILNGVRYVSPFTTKTLAAADPTNPRIDVFAVNTSGQVEVIQGTPNANPVEPEGDTPTTLGLTNVTINAGATTPNAVTKDMIYDENVETWTKTQSVTGSFNYNDTAFPYTGSKALLVTMSAGFADFRFSKATAMDITTYKSLSFAIRLNTAWTGNTALAVQFYNGTRLITNTYQITATNTVGFNRNLAGTYQLVTIPLNGTLLRFSQNTFTAVRIYTFNAAATYRLDTISLNGGINNPTGGGTTSANSFGFVNGSTGSAASTQATDTLNVVGTGLATTSATGKTLTIAVPTPIPSQTGNTGKFLTTDGSVVSWAFPTDTGITSLNGLGATTQTFATGTSGTDFGISSAGSTHTFNLPTASATNRGALSSADWSTFNGKQGALTLTTTGTSGAATLVGNTLNIPQYGGGGMSIGGTVTGGTTGSVLFVGASSALAQDNANFFWDDTNNRLGLNTNNPLTSLHLITTTAASTIRGLFIEQNTNDTGGGTFAFGKSRGSSAVINGDTLVNIFAHGWDGTAYKNCARIRFGVDAAVSANTVPTNISFWTGTTEFGTERFTISSGGNITLTGSSFTNRFTSAGRLLIGTTTESTFLLDVNGTARIVNQFLVDFQSGTTYTSKFGNTYIQSPAQTNNVIGFNTFYDGTNFKAISTGVINYIQAALGSFTCVGSNASVNAGSTGTMITYFDFNGTESKLYGGKFNSNSSTYVDFTLGNGYDNPRFIKLSYYTGGYSHYLVTRHDSVANSAQNQLTLYINNSTTVNGSSAPTTGNVLSNSNSAIHTAFFQPTLFKIGGTVSETPVTTAAVEIVSTTRGFLPPRMTTTQRNAIATPAAGLIVYDTTDNKHYGYNGTTWNAFF